ncbi:MAG: CHAT domain-containing protein [Lewinellaceae bacterium]|nr:CHAT domain-containing protein [Lewinellaceae bacterium]
MKKTPIRFVFVLAPLFAFSQPSDSISVLQRVDSLVQASRALTAGQNFEEAHRVNDAAEKIILGNLGKASAAYGRVCFNRGRIYDFAGNAEAAEKWYLESKTIREKALGREHAEYAESLNNLGGLYWMAGDNEQAEANYLEALAIREKALGKKHYLYAASLLNLGNVYEAMGEYLKVEPLYLEAQTVLRDVVGQSHPDYALCLSNLGSLYNTMGRFEKAEQLFLEVRQIYGGMAGEDPQGYISSLINLAIFYWDTGYYEKAERSNLEAKAACEKTMGKENEYYCKCLNNLGILYNDLGRFGDAERLFLEAVSISEAVPGKKHPGHATNLDNLAGLYYDMGNYQKGQSLAREATAIRERFLGREHPEYAASLHNLALFFEAMGDYDKAEPLHKEGRDIRAEIFGKNHPYYARSLSNLAGLYKKREQYGKAEPLYQEAKRIIAGQLGREHLDYAIVLSNLGEVYREMGRFEQSRLHFEEARDILERNFGKELPAWVNVTRGLAVLCSKTGDYERECDLLRESSLVEKVLLAKASRHLSEKELAAYTRNFIEGQNRSFSFLWSHPGLFTSAYDDILFSKGFLLYSARQASQLAQADAEGRKLYKSLMGCRRRLAKEYAKPIAERQNVAGLEEKANTLEKELARTVAGFGDAIRQVEWQEVQAALRPGEAAVEFVRYDFYNPDPTDSVFYAALLLRPGDEQPHFVPLFEEKELQGLLEGHPMDKKAYLNRLYGNEVAGNHHAGRLYRLIWQPLDSLLADIQTLYASPAGLLHRLNLSAVMVDGRHAFADRCRLSVTGSTRQLVVQSDSPFAVRNSPIAAAIYGGIRYDFDSAAMARPRQLQIDSTVFPKGEELSFQPIERGRSWDYLPGTAREAYEIQALIARQEGETETLQGYQATEESFKKIGKDGPSPHILHLATHGYFYPNPAERPNSSSSGKLGGAAFKISHHPMIRSGLLLAGGNQAWRGKPVPEGWEDGILTAYEVSQVDLRNTELVVLSACETGLGDIEGNEGVYGLQRAFKIAGADKLIMSLWAVPDVQTQEMMVLFYRYWLEEGIEIREAFRAAQGEMRKRYKEHYYWAAFVLVE